jgi:hypothetical protein
VNAKAQILIDAVVVVTAIVGMAYAIPHIGFLGHLSDGE